MSEVPIKNPLPDALLEAENLPSMPGVAVEVLRLCRDDDTTLDDLAAVLSHDAMAGQQEGHTVVAVGPTYRSTSGRPTDGLGDVVVTGRLAIGNAS